MSIETTRGGYLATPVQKAAFIVGIAFVAVGVLGFIPGATTGIESGMHAAGHQSDHLLLGVFQVSVLHNVLHLGLGLVGLALAAKARLARLYLLGGGAVYLILFAYGLFVAGRDDAANFIPLNWADNWLHLGLAAGMILLAVLLGRRGAPARA